MTKIDLHIHTTCSDGKFTPFEVIDIAKEHGTKIIAISDHDTVSAYSDDLFVYAKEKDITLIPAVEISTKAGKCGVHVLGYNVDYKNEIFNENLKQIRNARHDYLHNVSIKLNELGYFLNVNKLDDIDAVTKAHIALDIIDNDKNKDLLLKNFGHIPSKGEFIENVMNEGCPAYIQKLQITPKQAAEIIRSAGGKVVLAHPIAYSHEDELTENDIEKIIDEMKPDGLEAYYIYVDKNNIKYNEIEKWKKLATRKNLVVTIGSDFHNDDGIRPQIGFTNENIEFNNEMIENLVKFFKK